MDNDRVARQILKSNVARQLPGLALPNSTLQYPEAFQTDSRTVRITGEAYFEVHHDRQRPFTVNSHRLRIRVTAQSSASVTTAETVLVRWCSAKVLST